MVDRRQITKSTATAPRSFRGPVGLAALLVIAAMAVAIVEIAPPADFFKSPSVQADRPARPAPDADALQFVPEQNRDAESALAVLAEAIRDESDPTVREARIDMFLRRLAAEGFPAAMSRLSGLASGRLGDQLGARLMRHWAEVDVEAASRWAATSSDGSLRPILLEQAALVWAGRDLARASEWARSLNAEAERDEALRMIAHEAVRTEPVAALAVAVELPAGEPRAQLILRAASEWASTDPKGAVAWASQIADSTLRDSVLAGVAMAWGDKDPVAAATLAVSELPPGRVQADAVVSIVQRWAQADPQAAASWVSTFAESAMRDAALENLAKLWTGEVRGVPGS